MNKNQLIEWYRGAIWRDCDSDCSRRKALLIGEIDAIIESHGLEPFNWSHSPEKVSEWAKRELKGSPAALSAIRDRVKEMADIDRYHVSVLKLTHPKRKQDKSQ